MKTANRYLATFLSLGIFLFFTSENALASQPPQAVSVTPDNLSIEANTPQTFTTLYSDPNGAEDIRYCLFLINTRLSSSGAFYGYYYRSANRLYLYDSQARRWASGTPGTSTTIENYYVKLNLQNTIVTAQDNNISINWDITFKDTFAGTKKTYLYVRDNGYLSSGWRELGAVTVYTDTTPPQGSITINGDDEYVNQGQVTLTLSATDDLTGVDNMQFSNDGITWSPAENYDTTKIWDLNPGDGEKTVYVQFSDVAGNWSNPISDSIILDTTPPVPTITSPVSGFITNSSGILIEGTIDDPTIDTVTIVVRLHDGTDYNIVYQWWDFLADSGTFTVDLRSADYLREGHSRIEAAVQDAAGNPGWTGSLVVLDTIQPQGSIIINSGLQYTNQAQVILGISATDESSGIATMRFSNDGTTWSTPENYSTTKTWTLNSDDGEKTVYARFSDIAGNWSQGITDTIILDAIRPTGSISIDEDSQYANQPQVTLNLSAADNSSGIDRMQFSNDGVNWSVPEIYSPTKIWELTADDGEKTVYVKFSDVAGNWSQVYSDSIILYTGTLIDPTVGGEVYSPDGKVKLVIPAGAFGNPARIFLTLIDPTVLQAATPENYKLKTVVECKPVGLIFWEICQLVITLDEPEIPGTPIELGLLYDQIIEFTESSAPILSDGITVQFPINHFSTYAGLSGMISQGAPIGAGVDIPLPDMFTGAFGHGIPITAPPGRKNLQPKLNLQYRSSTPNSFVGVGWSMTPEYIVRSTKLGPPSYNDTEDTFLFITDAGSTELVHLIDNLYQAKIESAFAKFFKEADDSWRVVQKDGTVLRFGQTTDSKEITPSGTYLWNLTKAIDNNGNFIELLYTKDQEKSYLYQIEYTGNEITGTPPTNTIEFSLESRDDFTSSYISGAEIKLAKRLSEIYIKVQNDLVWRYLLTYEYSPDTNRSLLKTVTKYSSDGQAFPTQTFSYQRADDD